MASGADMPPNKQALLLDCFTCTTLPPPPRCKLLGGCAGMSPFKSTKHSASIVLCAQSASKEISLLKNNHICQQFPSPAPHQQVLSHALFSLSPQNTSPGRTISATFTDKDHLNSKVAELEPQGTCGNFPFHDAPPFKKINK